MLDIEINFVCDPWTLGCFYGLCAEESSNRNSSNTDQNTTEIHDELKERDNYEDVATATILGGFLIPRVFRASNCATLSTLFDPFSRATLLVAVYPFIRHVTFNPNPSLSAT